MGEEIQTSGNGSWSAAGGLEEVEKKGLPTLPLPPKVEEEKKWSKGNRPYAPPKMDPVQIMCTVGLGIFTLKCWGKLSSNRCHPCLIQHTAESPSLPLCVTSRV